MSKTIEITNGPSREELFDGLKYTAEKRLVPFSCNVNDIDRFLAGLVTSIQAEDGSGESWNITLSVEKACLDSFKDLYKDSFKGDRGAFSSKGMSFSDLKEWLLEEKILGPGIATKSFLPKNGISVRAHFSTKYRTGVITVEE